MSRSINILFFLTTAALISCARAREGSEPKIKPVPAPESPARPEKKDEATPTTTNPVSVPEATPAPGPTPEARPEGPTPDSHPRSVPIPRERPSSRAPREDAHNYRAAVWAHVSGAKTWTEVSLKMIRARMGDFDHARDKSEFCPGYESATSKQRESCWLRLVGGVAKFESGFNPADSFKEANGINSVGLLALSARECKNAPTEKLLKKPLLNLSCGINMMADLISRDGFIDGPKRSRGAATYWSTLREPYNSGNFKVGKKFKIIAITKSYREF